MIIKDIPIISGTDGVISYRDTADVYRISGTINPLAASWELVFSGTHTYGQVVWVHYVANATLGVGVHIGILDTAVPDEYAAKEFIAYCQYNQSATWNVIILPSFTGTNIITTLNLLAKCVTTAKIDDKAVDTGQVADGAIEALQLNTDAVETLKIKAKNVTYAKIQDETANTVLCNSTGSAAAPSELAFPASTILARLAAGNLKACTVVEIQTLLSILTTSLTSAKILVGNVSNVATAVSMSGDATIDDTGSLTISDSSVTPQKLGQKVVTSRTTGIVACKFLDGANLKALLNTVTNTLFSMTLGDTVLRVDFITQTPHGAPCKVIMGPDAVMRTAGVDIDGFIVDALASTAEKYTSDDYSYSGALLKFGQFTADATGNITIKTDVDATAGAFVGFAIVYYLPV
jgi:hypothetical protein